MVHYMLRSREFLNPGNWHSRYSWPVEYVVRAIKEVGWSGFSIDTARNALIPMGQVLFEPPDVAGWELGQGWFSTGAMLSRMNFAGTLAFNQRFNLARDAGGARQSPDALLEYMRSPAGARSTRAVAAEPGFLTTTVARPRWMSLGMTVTAGAGGNALAKVLPMRSKPVRPDQPAKSTSAGTQSLSTPDARNGDAIGVAAGGAPADA
jgi:hypothetical protein